MGNNRAQGTFAWIDFSSTDVGVVMQMDPVDVSAIASPNLLCLLSDIGTYTVATPNILHVEAYNGTSWDSVSTIQEFTTGWVNKVIDISSHAVSGVVSLRFRGESSGLSSDYYNDLCIDDICVSGPPVSGCTNANACNYDPAANIDDGSCTMPGCNDPLANNYDPAAGCDDGSCLYACTQAPYAEDFEAGLGTWTTANTGTGSYPGWYRDSGGTPSSGTGPSSGANGSTWYMFIETSASRRSLYIDFRVFGYFFISKSST